jgi:uncharacterized membrane protein YfcA
MGIMMALSNAGGISGAGSTIPIMLIFFNMNMNNAIPLASFIGVMTTIIRFSILINKNSPKNKAKHVINYEIIMLTLPSVLLGSFIGVLLS